MPTMPEPIGRYTGPWVVYTLDEFRANHASLGAGVAYYGFEEHESSKVIDPAAIDPQDGPLTYTHAIWYPGKTASEVKETWFT